MGKYKDLVEDHLNARIGKNKEASNVLGVLRGEVETTLKNEPNADADEVVEVAAKKMVKGLEAVGGEDSKREIEILEPYLPETLNDDQIIAELDKLNLDESMPFGRKMGMAMKAIEGRADGADVKRIVMKYYN